MIGDVHAEDAALEVALASLRALDAVLCVGDVVDGAGDVERCCELLRDAGALVVRGNHERWLLAGKMRSLPDATDVAQLPGECVAWIASLPPTLTLETIAGRLLLCHAVGDDDMSRLAEDDGAYALASNAAFHRVLACGAKIMVCGHTHRAYVRRIDDLLIVNGGTLYRAHEPGFVSVDLEAGIVVRCAIAHGRALEIARIALP